MIKLILKLSFAAGLIYWLIHSGRIDFSILQQSLNYKLEWGICFFLVFCNILIASYRWRCLLHLKSSKKFSYLSIVKLTWVGLLFNTILPGVVSGDLIKLVYAKDLDKNMSKTFLVTSAFMDRILGLFGLLTLMGFSSIVYYGDLVTASPAIKHLIHLNFLLFSGMIAFLITIFLPKRIQNLMLNYAEKIPVLGKHFSNTFQQVWVIGDSKKIVFFSIFLSILTHMFNITAFWTIASPFFTVDVPYKFAFTFIPLGLISIAIPITPAGLGIGHAIFDTLFSYFGVNKGASLFNFYFITMTVANLSGIVPYLSMGKKHSTKEISEFETVSS